MSIERLHGLSAFVRVVEAGSFTAGAKLLGTTPSAVSKSIARLEARLGVKLFQRSTRAFALTDEGKAYYERVASLVRGLEEAAEVLSAPAGVAGRLRISMPSDLGRSLLAPITAKLMPRHPSLALDVSLGDQHVDLIREGFDLALRVGHAVDSGLYARRIARLPLTMVASAAYLARHGTPATLAELQAHRFVRYKLAGHPVPVVLADGTSMPAHGPFETDSGEALRIAALNGVGIAQMLQTAVQADLDADRLRIVLPDLPRPLIPLQVLHGFGRRMPGRAKVLIDFIVAELANAAR